MMTDRIGIRCYVTGKVQGVWFRASTKEQADQLQIVGWARNLTDGRVEVIAYGEREKLAKLYEWLKEGPQLAHVTDLTYEELPWEGFQNFEVR